MEDQDQLILPGKEVFLKENRLLIDERMYYPYRANVGLISDILTPDKSLLGAQGKIIFGTSGCGKTTILKNEIEKYKEKNPSLIYIYVDLSAINTTTELLQGIMAQIKSQDPWFFKENEKEIESRVIYNKNQPLKLITYYFLFNKRPTIMVWDEFDKLYYFSGAGFKKYLISSMIDIYKHEIAEQERMNGRGAEIKPQYLIFLLTNNPTYANLLSNDFRTKSPPIRFISYKAHDLKEIMKRTAEVCFNQKFFDQGEGKWMDIISKYVSKECRGDSRAALRIMITLFDSWHKFMGNKFVYSSEILDTNVTLAIADYEKELSTKEILQYDTDKKIILLIIAAKKLGNQQLISYLDIKTQYESICRQTGSKPKKEGLIYRTLNELEENNTISKDGAPKKRRYRPEIDLKKARLIFDLLKDELGMEESRKPEG